MIFLKIVALHNIIWQSESVSSTSSSKDWNLPAHCAGFFCPDFPATQQPAGALGSQPLPEPMKGVGESDKLSASVARHLKRYFDLHGGQLPPAGVYQRILREVEMPLIEIALDATAGNQAKCADLLGINRNTLRKKITDLDIRVTRRRKLM